MALVALSAGWIGVIGAAVGGLVGVLGTLLGQRLDRHFTIGERSREERKEVYVAFLTSVEDSLHQFERLAEGKQTKAGRAEDLRKADYFYDEQVTPRYKVMELIGRQDVVDAAGQLRDALNDIKKLMTVPTSRASKTFKQMQKGSYRPARRNFIALASRDLEPPRPWWKRKPTKSIA